MHNIIYVKFQVVYLTKKKRNLHLNSTGADAQDSWFVGDGDW
jgi:hypothetical protein